MVRMRRCVCQSRTSPAPRLSARSQAIASVIMRRSSSRSDVGGESPSRFGLTRLVATHFARQRLGGAHRGSVDRSGDAGRFADAQSRRSRRGDCIFDGYNQASTGSFTIAAPVAPNATEIDGSFDITFDVITESGRFTGTFKAPVCPRATNVPEKPVYCE